MQIFKKTKLIDLLSYNIADNAAEISKIYFSFYREIYTQNLYVTAFYKVSLLFSLRTYMSKHSQCILPSTDLSGISLSKLTKNLYLIIIQCFPYTFPRNDL